MSRVRRILSWALFLGFLWAVGWAVFVYVRHTPRCVIEGPLVAVHLSLDGSRLVTTTRLQPNGRPGALQVREIGSGRVIYEISEEHDIQAPSFSPDGRHAAVAVGGALWLIDCQSGQDWRFDDLHPSARADFSPQGRWLLGMSADGRCCIDVARRQVEPAPDGEFLCFNKDERPVFITRQAPDELFVWDPNQRKKIAKVAWKHDVLATSSDGALAAIVDRGPIDIDGEFNYVVDVWDLATLERRFQHKVSKPTPQRVEIKLSPDARLLAVLAFHYHKKDCDVEFLDTAHGRTLAAAMCAGGKFSPDGSLWYFHDPVAKDRAACKVLDVATGRLLWEAPVGRTTWDFAGDTRVLLYQEDGLHPLELLEARTGKVRAVVSTGFRTQSPATLAADGRHVTILGWQTPNRPLYFWEQWLRERWPNVFGDTVYTLVMETRTGREALRVPRGSNGHLLSDNAGTLVTIDHLSDPAQGVAIRVWDVAPAKAYLWATGAAAGTGIALIGLNRVRRKLRGRKTSAPAFGAGMNS